MILNLFSNMGKTVNGNIFGVKWNVNGGADLTRLNGQNDPYRYVNTNIITEPVPTSSYSPFDNFAPWKYMIEANIYSPSTSETVIRFKGESGFTTVLDVFVYIPIFYYKVIKENDCWYYYVSDSDNSDLGFQRHPASGRFIGKYKSGLLDTWSYGSSTQKTQSLTGSRETINYNMMDFENAAHYYSTIIPSNTTTSCSIWACDIATRSAVQLLYLIEFASWDYSTKIGRPVAPNNTNSGGGMTSFSRFSVGGSDSINYHTGNNSGYTKYRNIENLFGGNGEMVSGFYPYYNSATITFYVQSVPTYVYFSSPTSSTAVRAPANTQLFSLGFSASTGRGYIKDFGYSETAPWCCFIPISYVNTTTPNYTRNYVNYGDYGEYLGYTTQDMKTYEYTTDERNFFSMSTAMRNGHTYAEYIGRLVVLQTADLSPLIDYILGGN